jgi:redox-sensitive bicupin YhaK (pirin superfamily)
VDALASVDGAGVKLHRALGQPALGMLDPFLLLDEIHSDDPNDYAAGFPEHPHRGFETVTYMIDGAMEHRDSVGNHGHLGPGSAQWMTAGHGIVHSEMPRQDRGRMWGFQLWVNLPAVKKMIRPRYQDIAPERIVEVAQDRARVRVVAGRAFGAVGPVTGIEVDPLFLDLDLEKGALLEHAVEEGHAAFAYVPAGAVRIGQGRTEVRAGQLAVLGRGDSLEVRCDAAEGRVLLFAGRPIGEPVARSGPFVMNTNDELRKAWEDYRAGRLTQG